MEELKDSSPPQPRDTKLSIKEKNALVADMVYVVDAEKAGQIRQEIIDTVYVLQALQFQSRYEIDSVESWVGDIQREREDDGKGPYFLSGSNTQVIALLFLEKFQKRGRNKHFIGSQLRAILERPGLKELPNFFNRSGQRKDEDEVENFTPEHLLTAANDLLASQGVKGVLAKAFRQVFKLPQNEDSTTEDLPTVANGLLDPEDEWGELIEFFSQRQKRTSTPCCSFWRVGVGAAVVSVGTVLYLDGKNGWEYTKAVRDWFSANAQILGVVAVSVGVPALLLFTLWYCRRKAPVLPITPTATHMSSSNSQ